MKLVSLLVVAVHFLAALIALPVLVTWHWIHERYRHAPVVLRTT